MVDSTDYKALYEAQQVKISMLEAELAQLKRMIFGARTEQFHSTAGAAQLSLNIEAETVAATSLIKEKKISYTRIQSETKPVHIPVRMKLPDHLERRDTIIEPEQSLEGLRRMGEEITEELEYEPGKLYVNRLIRPKYVTADHADFVIAPMPDRPLPKAIAGPGLLTQILIDKYVDHIPLHRQQQRFSRERINIPYSTITDWVSNSCQLLIPLYDALVKEVMSGQYLHVDETPIQVLDKDKKGQTHRGFYWVYHNSLQDLVLFEYQPGRSREGPSHMLKDFKGRVQTDGYSGYNFLNKEKDINLFHCWAHARRKFYEALSNDQARATYALEQIQLLYAIERKAAEAQIPADELLAIRQNQAVPVLEALKVWMIKTYQQVTPASAIGKALAYSLKLWNGLTAYTKDGKLNIDNNKVENAIRPVAIGRKNYLFAGSHEAAQRSAILYSLLGTCKLHQINPSEWMKDVMKRIAKQPLNQINLLLPHKWHPEINN